MALFNGGEKSFARGLSIGLGVAVLGFLLLPSTRKALRPLLVAGLRGLMDLADQAKGSVATAREELEDILAEAQFERLRQAAVREAERSPAPDVGGGTPGPVVGPSES